MYKEIDINSWIRKEQYKYFSTFANPCYGFDVEMDINDIYKYTKETNTSFFINFLFLLSIGLNMQEELRLRILDGRVVLFDEINPSYTIMKNDGNFDNGGHKMTYDYQEFYDNCKNVLETHKAGLAPKKEKYNDSKLFDDFYITCIPWIKYESMTHPMPDNDPSNQSVPRICWGKYYQKDGRMKVLLNITVSHVLCDGFPLSQAFIKIQNVFDNAYKYFK